MPNDSHTKCSVIGWLMGWAWKPQASINQLHRSMTISIGSLAEDLQLAGVEGQKVYVCVAPPMIVGVWSMWQLLEYYYWVSGSEPIPNQ